MRKEIFYILSFVIFLYSILFFCLGCDDIPDPNDVTDKPEDICPYYDSDCDEISNAVENNDANDYLNLNPNAKNSNPSIAHGDPCVGWLENGLNLVNTGTGYYHYNPEADMDDWGTLHLINMIEISGRIWNSSFKEPPRISIGDLSLKYGGTFAPHGCHENGLEVDIRYVRNDGQEAVLNIAKNPEYYDIEKTQFLINRLIFNAKVELIYCDTVNIGLKGGPLVHRDGHSDHFHVRIVDPDGTSN
ncbi:MAG: penicillin-insensitive murein endopeptidase [candidate division Zixibacteria bacterium]|nr:penicillin-insensitive murein endopeptidase [candidate division Zixibacteria bacterium]MDD5426069.1 penicillin-insensitive murein endopeptidase [candidate division Zixibacteria bacterium]